MIYRQASERRDKSGVQCIYDTVSNSMYIYKYAHSCAVWTDKKERQIVETIKETRNRTRETKRDKETEKERQI
jgi:hypothetical protein